MKLSKIAGLIERRCIGESRFDSVTIADLTENEVGSGQFDVRMVGYLWDHRSFRLLRIYRGCGGHIVEATSQCQMQFDSVCQKSVMQLDELDLLRNLLGLQAKYEE
jgi:hypothetical protein